MFRFNASPIYHANATSKADVIIHQGGTDSGKTYSTIQNLLTIAATPYSGEDPVITVVGETIPNLKAGAYRKAKDLIYNTPGLQNYVEKINETERKITFKTGWVMEFNSYKDEQGAKQGKRQYSFFNEANGIPYSIFWQVAKRTRKQVFIDYNPSAPFWCHEKLIGTTANGNDLSANVQLFISDHRHNPFLSPKDHYRTENIQDPELWKVYARGLTGNIEGLIYPNWQRIPEENYPKDVDIFGGLDFGYTVDPTAGVKLAVVGNNLYIRELLYEPGISSVNTVQTFKANGFTGKDEVYCENDSDQVRDLRKHGLLALLARKGQGSVKGGIKKVKEFNVFYTESSVNLHRERQKYIWTKDRLTNQITNVPIDAFNHLMDAIRYGVYSKYYRTGL